MLLTIDRILDLFEVSTYVFRIKSVRFTTVKLARPCLLPDIYIQSQYRMKKNVFFIAFFV